jgi:hypothetical protein
MQSALADSGEYSMDGLPSLDAPDAEKDRRWRTWAAKEIQQRALLGHYLLDGLISRMPGKVPSARHAAKTANEWLTNMRSQETVQLSFRSIFRSLYSPTEQIPRIRISTFSLRVVLEGIQSLVAGSDSDDVPCMGTPTKAELRRALALLRESITNSRNISDAERLETFLRWHTICLDICKDSSMLCRAVCSRYGIDQHVVGGKDALPSKPEIDLVSWVNTEDARRALLHAAAIQEIVEALPRGRAQVIHMPSSLFASATIYCVFSLGELTSVNIPRSIDWKTVLSMNFEACSRPGQPDSISESETKRYMRGEYSPASGAQGDAKNLLYELNSMQKLFRCLCSQWGIAYDMEDVVGQWISLWH